MNRNDFSFLEAMFVNNRHFSNYNLIIVNQTKRDVLLESKWPNIKVINSFTIGSPFSRNTAIFHATKDICLMADDDIIYEKGFDSIILNAYSKDGSLEFLSFEAENQFGNKQAKYPSEGMHTRNSLRSIYTWVITFRLKTIRESGLFFNHYFGVGSEFKGMTEIMFLRRIWDSGIQMHHHKKTIVQHPEDSSGRHMGSDDSFYARSAGAQRFYGNLSYLWLVKYTIFALLYKHIEFGEIKAKLEKGLSGISSYKRLEKKGLIEKVYYEN